MTKALLRQSAARSGRSLAALIAEIDETKPRDSNLSSALRVFVLNEALAGVEGAYSLILMMDGRLIAIRDPRGYRPLCFGRVRNGGWAVASESCALDIVDAELERELKPGEIINRRQIATRLDMSVAPVLEAMLRLESEGYLETLPRKTMEWMNLFSRK